MSPLTRAIGVILAITIVPLGTLPLRADQTWTAGSSTDFLWSNAANWSGGVPLDADNVVFGTPVLNPGSLANPGVIILGAASAANALSFEDSYTLTGGDLSLTTGAVRVDMALLVTMGSQLLGPSGLVKTGLGTLRLTNASNAYLGTTIVNEGILSISSAGALGSDSSAIVVAGSAVRGFGGGQLQLAGSYPAGMTLTRGLSLTGTGPTVGNNVALQSVGTNAITGAVTNGAGTANTAVASAAGRLTLGDLTLAGTAGSTFLTFGAANGTGAGSYAVTGTLSGTGSIGKTGGGALFLTPSSAAGWSGTLQVSAGSVRVTDTAALGTSASSAAIDLNGGTLELRTDSTGFASAKRINLNNGQGTVDLLLDHAPGSTVLNQTFTFANYDYDGDETMFIVTRNGYGATFSAATALGSSTTAVTVTNNGNGLVTYGGTLWGQTSGTASSLTINGSGSTTLTGSITASGAAHTFIKSGTGLVTVQGTAGTYTGAMTISGGALVITDFRTLNAQGAGTMGTNTSAINIGSGATAGVLTIGAATATANGLTLLTGKTLALNGTTGGATINASQAFAAPVIVGSGVTITSGAGTKVFTLGGTSTQDNAINAVIVDNSAANITHIVKADSGTWVLGGTNTNTGATTVTGGTLKLAGTNTTVLNDSSPFSFGQNAAAMSAGGTLTVQAASGTETLGPLDLIAGAGTVNVTGAAGAVSFASVGTSQATTAASSASTTVTVASTAGLVPGMIVTGTGVSANAVISSISSGTTFVASASQTIASGVTLTFSRPSGVVQNGGGTVNFTPGTGSVVIASVPAVGLLNAYSSFNGANFAYAPTTTNATLRAPVYGVDAGFNTVAISAALSSASNNQLVSTSGTSGNVTQGAAVTVPTLKLAAGTTLTANALVTLQTAAGNPGGILLSGGSATIAGSSGITSGGAGDVVVRTDLSGDILTLSATGGITSTTTGGLTKTGAGTLLISATNAQTGTTNINEGTIKLSGAGKISGNGAGLNIRQGALLDLNGVTMAGTPIGALNGAGNIGNTSATAVTVTVGNGNGTGTFSGSFNQTSGAIGVTKNGTGGQTWSGTSNYTGVTNIASTGLVSVAALANIGSDSSIGRGDNTSDASNAASLVFSGTTGGIAYTGTASVSIDRLFTMSGGGQIANNSGNNSTLVLNKSNAVSFGTTAAQTLTLGGSSTGDNRINLQLVNPAAGALSLSKTGAGLWILGNAGNSYSGNTTIGATTTAGGVLQAVDGASLPSTSALVIGGTTGGGVFQTSGSFVRPVNATPTAGQVTFNSALTTGAVGFAAAESKLIVALGGLESPAALTWGSGGFMGVSGTSTGAFVLNSVYSLAEIEVRNAINLGSVTRTIQVDDNNTTAGDFATITGVLSGTGGLTKTGAGTLQLFGANTYSGVTAVTAASTLTVNSLGDSGTPGVGTSVGSSTNAQLAANAITLGNGGTTAAVLQYVGPGETSDRMIRLNTTTGGTQIHADGAGPLVLTNVVNDMAAGNKTLFLRGANTQGNTIASQLTDNAAGTNTLGVSIDGGATWILTGNNSYTGLTDVAAGAAGAGHDSAFGTSILRLRNGSLFASGGDRTLANSISVNTTTTAGTTTFIGDYSLALTGGWTLTNTSAGHTITNSVALGKTVVISGNLSFNALSANITQTINGTGDTTINGNITTSALFNVNPTYAGTGSLTLGGAGNAFWGNATTAGAFTISSGTVRLGANEVIPNGTGAGANGSLVISPAAGVTATLDLNGKNETINGLTANSTGSIVINNSSAGVATLTVGDATILGASTVAFGGGSGTYAISQTGGGAVNLAKIGAGTANFTGTLGNTGSTTVSGGILNYNSPTGSTSASVASGAALNFKGGLATPSSMTSITVAGGGFLSFASGSGQPVANLSALSLGVGAGTATLELDAGDASTDALTLPGGAATAANTISLLIKDIDISNGGVYTLISAPGGGLTAGGATYTLNLAGYTGSSLASDDYSVVLTAGTLNTSNVYWNGGTGGTAWNTVVTGTPPDLTNFSSDGAGLMTVDTLPGKGQKVIFVADSLTGGVALSTTLEQPFKINALEFRQNTNPADTPSSISIAPGAIASNSLTLAPSSSADGITLQAGASPVVNISAPVVTQGAQSWTVTDAAQVLNVSGALSGTGSVTKLGAGKLTLSAATTSFTGAFAVDAGTAEVTVATALSGVVATPGTGAAVSIGGTGAFYYNNAAAGTLPNNITLAGGTLSSGGNSQTYSGAINVSATSSINLRDLNSAVTSTAARNTTLSGVLSGASGLTLDSVDTVTSGNQITGTLTVNNGAGTWNGALDFTRGTVVFTNAAGGGSLTPYVGYDGTIDFNQFGRVIYRNVDGGALSRTAAVTFAAGAVGEFQVDNLGALAANYTLTQGGVVNLNAGSIARFNLQDAASNLALTGGVVLNGNASLTVAGGDADSLVSINTTGISGTGDLAINDEAGVWNVTSSRLAINAAGTYTGNTTLNEGTLILGHKDALGAGSLTTTGAATLQAGIDLSAGGGGPLPNAVILGTGGLTVSGTNSLTTGGIVTGVGADADRTLTSSITGPASLTIDGGLNLAAAASTAARTFTLAGTGATTLSSAIADGSAFANNFTVTNSGVTTLSGTNTYSGTTTMNAAAGTLLLQGANSSAGATTLTNGRIQFDSASNGGLASGLLTLTAGTLEALNAPRSVSNTTTLAGSITVAGNQNLTLAGVVTQSNGSRTLTNSLTAGAFRINTLNLAEAATARTLTVTGTGATIIGSVTNNGASNVITSTVSGGGSLTIDTAIALSESSTARTLTINGTGDTTVTGAITNGGTGAGVLTKSGAGTLILGSTGNAYTGGTNINFGTLRTTAGNVLPGTGTITVNATTAGTALLDLNGNSDTIAALTLGGTGGLATSVNQVTTGAGVLTLGGTLTVSATGNWTTPATISGNLALGTAARTVSVANSTGTDVDLDLQALVSGSAQGITKTGAGTLLLGAANTYTGATVANNGVVRYGINNAVNSASAVTVNANAAGTTAVLDLNNFNGAIASLTIGGTSQTATSVAIVQTGTGTLTLNGNVTTSATGNPTTTPIITGNLSLGTAARTFTVADSTGSSIDLDVQAVVSGSGALIKSGAGVMALSNAANLYTGATTISQGVLGIASEGSLGPNPLFTTPDALNIGAATLAVTTTFDIDDAHRGVTLGGAATIDVGAGATLGINNKITGGGSLTKTGAGTLTLSGGTQNNYSGATTITAGVLKIGAAGSIPDGPSGGVSLAGTLDLNGFDEYINGLTGAGVADNTAATAVDFGVGGSNATTTFSGVIQNSGGGALQLTKYGTGTLTLSGSNSYTGPTAVTAGILEVAHSSALGSNAAGTTVSAGARLVLQGGVSVAGESLSVTSDGSINPALSSTSGSNTWSGVVTANHATNAVRVAASSGSTLTLSGPVSTTGIVFQDNGTVVVSGDISGSGFVGRSSIGSGVLVLGGTGNSYNGNTNISTGTIRLGASDVIPDGTGKGSLTFDTGSGTGLFDLNGFNEAVNGLDDTASAASTVVDNTAASTSSVLTIGGNNVSSTFHGIIANSGAGASLALVKTGTGTQILTGSNTFAGGLTISGGVLQIGEGGGFGTLGSGAVTNDASLVFNRNDSFSVANAISGTGTVTQNGVGTLALGAANTYSGRTYVSRGTLSIAAVDASPSATQSLGTHTDLDLGVAATSSGTLRYTGAAGTLAKNINVLGNGSDTIQNAGAGLLALSGTITKAGTTLTLAGGASGIMVTGSIIGASSGSDLIINGGATTLANANTYNGPTYIRNGATLNANATDALPTANGRSHVILDDTGSGSSTLSLGANQSVASITGVSTSGIALGTSTLTIGASGGSTTFAGAIGGAGDLVKDDGSTLVLSGPNTYSGSTLVSAGTLQVNHASGLGSTAGGTTVAGGATLYLNNADIGGESVTINGSGVGGLGALQASGTTTLGAPLNIATDSVIGVASGGDTLYLNGNLTGSGGYTKVGGGTVVVTGSGSTYSGITTVSSGTLVVNNANALGGTAGGTVVAPGAVLELGGGVSVGNESLVLQSTGSTSYGTLRSSTGTNTWGGSISFTGGHGTLNAAAGSTLNVTGATIDKSDVVLSVTGGGTVNISSVITGDGNATAFDDDLEVNGGTLQLNNLNTYTGPTKVYNGGTLRNGITDALPNSSTVGSAQSTTLSLGHVSDGAVTNTYDLNGYGQTVATLTSIITGPGTNIITNHSATTASTLSVSSGDFAGSIQNGSGGQTVNLVKQGASGDVLLLRGASSYTGTTVVMNGTLQVGYNGAGTTGSGNVSVAGGSTIAGSGAVLGALTVSGVLSPGDAAGASLGVLDVGGHLTLTGTATTYFTIGDPNLVFDQVHSTLPASVLTLGGFIDVGSAFAGGYIPVGGEVYSLFDGFGSITGVFDVGADQRNGGTGGGALNLPALPGILKWDLSQFMTNGTIAIYVPEPGRATLLLIGLLSLFAPRRRRAPKLLPQPFFSSLPMGMNDRSSMR